MSYMKLGKYLLMTIMVLNLLSISFAGSSNIASALKQLCNDAQLFMGVAAMVLIVLAGTTYAIGQVMGAETRARASVWATAMLTGAIIGIIIYLLAPPLIGTLLSGTGVSVTTGGNPCA